MSDIISTSLSHILHTISLSLDILHTISLLSRDQHFSSLQDYFQSATHRKVSEEYFATVEKEAIRKLYKRRKLRFRPRKYLDLLFKYLINR